MAFKSRSQIRAGCGSMRPTPAARFVGRWHQRSLVRRALRCEIDQRTTHVEAVPAASQDGGSIPPPPLAQIPLSCSALQHARQGDFEFSAVPEGFCAEAEQVCFHDCDLQSCSEIAAFPKSKIGTSKMISFKSDVCSSLTWIRQSQ